jgi:hypothetical protein
MKYFIVGTYHSLKGDVIGADIFHSDVCLDPKQMFDLLGDIPEETNEIVMSQSFSDDVHAPFVVCMTEIEPLKTDKSFVAHDDATSDGCVSCGNDWKSLNSNGRCSRCEQVWSS